MVNGLYTIKLIKIKAKYKNGGQSSHQQEFDILRYDIILGPLRIAELKEGEFGSAILNEFLGDIPVNKGDCIYYSQVSSTWYDE